jgi:hypothetical protein
VVKIYKTKRGLNPYKYPPLFSFANIKKSMILDIYRIENCKHTFVAVKAESGVTRFAFDHPMGLVFNKLDIYKENVRLTDLGNIGIKLRRMDVQDEIIRDGYAIL